MTLVEFVLKDKFPSSSLKGGLLCFASRLQYQGRIWMQQIILFNKTTENIAFIRETKSRLSLKTATKVIKDSPK